MSDWIKGTRKSRQETDIKTKAEKRQPTKTEIATYRLLYGKPSKDTGRRPTSTDLYNRMLKMRKEKKEAQGGKSAEAKRHAFLSMLDEDTKKRLQEKQLAPQKKIQKKVEKKTETDEKAKFIASLPASEKTKDPMGMWAMSEEAYKRWKKMQESKE